MFVIQPRVSWPATEMAYPTRLCVSLLNRKWWILDVFFSGSRNYDNYCATFKELFIRATEVNGFSNWQGERRQAKYSSVLLIWLFC